MKVFTRHEIYTMQNGEQISVFYKPEVDDNWIGIMRKHLIAYNTDGIEGFVQYNRNHNQKHFPRGEVDNDQSGAYIVRNKRNKSSTF